MRLSLSSLNVALSVCKALVRLSCCSKGTMRGDTDGHTHKEGKTARKQLLKFVAASHSSAESPSEGAVFHRWVPALEWRGWCWWWCCGGGDADKLCRRCVLICCKMFHHRHFVPFARCRRRRANPFVFCLCRCCCSSPWRVAASEESPTLRACSFFFQKLWNPQTPPL